MTTAEKSGRRKKKVIDLFNFDNTFSLDSVEDLLRATKAKVDFEISIAKHYFPLCVMPELCKSIIPKMEMDVAVFVLNANESCLIINDEKSGSGYTKMYRALLQATGDKVLLVIGADDNYKSHAERNGNVLSSWAKRIMMCQLNEQFLDGRKGFVFSWDKKHRQIHEEALLHYLDPKNVGLKKFKLETSQDAKSATVSDEETKETDGNSGQNHLGDNDAGNDKSPGRSKEGDESCNRDLDATATQLSSVRDGWLYAMKGEKVRLLIKAHLRNGTISKEDGDFWFSNWTVPDYIQDDLMSKYSDTSVAELMIFYDESGTLRSSVTPKENFLLRSFKLPMKKASPRELLAPNESLMLNSFIRDGKVSVRPEDVEFRSTQKASPYELLAPNESLMLKTLILGGKVSLRPEDVEHRYPGWQIPDHVIKRIEQNEWATSRANLSIISDELGNLRCVVQIGTFRKAQTVLNKLTHSVSEITMNDP